MKRDNGLNTYYPFSGGGSGTSNYNDLSNKPIINQDLDDVSFTPVANTYYRHIGASATNYVIGGIYYYDGTGFTWLAGQTGTKLYEHNLSFAASNVPELRFILYSASPTRITLNDFYWTYWKYASLVPFYNTGGVQYMILGAYFEYFYFEEEQEDVLRAVYSCCWAGGTQIQTYVDSFLTSLLDTVTEL